MKNNKKIRLVTVFTIALFALGLLALNVHAARAVVPGTDAQNVGPSKVTMGSIVPMVTEVGKISWSIDGLGVYPGASGIIQVEKPPGATVRKAYMGAATTGFMDIKLADGDITIDGVGVTWDIETSSSIYS
jgi:hypothetical protein